MSEFLRELSPILVLLAVIAIVIRRLPRVQLGHSDAFRTRRIRNWLPVGFLYAFLYMGRYNLTVSKNYLGDLMSNNDFGWIFGVGTAVYGASFLINGPLTDRIGGKRSILIGSAGALVANLAMGLVIHLEYTDNLKTTFSLLYAVNMYFQSFGAVAIVKINAPWFHVRERGVFGAIFGVLISLGIYFAFDIGDRILQNFPIGWVFFVPAILLGITWLIVAKGVQNTPGDAGHADFDTADASSGDDGPQLGAVKVISMMLRNPVIVTIACIEFCSGFLRQAIMQWYRIFAKQTGQSADNWVYDNWGLLLCCAGIMGGVLAGVISDRVFQSRRGPVAAILYSFMLAGAIGMVFVLESPLLGALIIFMSMSVIGVHGMLSGTASMDFGGRKNVGVAVGIIDGFVYAGTAVMSFTYGRILPNESEVAAVVSNWKLWPVAMIPMAAIGLALAIRVWHAKPTSAKAAR